MRKLVGSAILASAVLSTAALATNGDNMIGVSPASRAMGGIGVGMPVGKTDAIFRNPAWMSAQKGFNVSFGGILFMPDVKSKGKNIFASNNPNNWPSFDETSDSDMFTIPEIAIVNQMNDQLTFGIGAFGVSGMGVDYRNTYAAMYTNFQFMRIIPAVSYKVMPGLSIGGAVDLAWGSLDMGQGASQSYGLGAQLGVAYDLGMIQVGVAYQSEVAMKYEKVYDSDGDMIQEDMKLNQPQEFAIGLGVKPLDNLELGLDVRWINWSGAKGYKDFGWDDQWVFAIGGKYKIDKLALRAGYNYGKSPIDDYNVNMMADPQNKSVPDLNANFNNTALGFFNLLGFPAIAEHHITLGAGYQFTEHFTVNVSYVYSPEVKKSLKDQNMGTLIETKMTQQSIGVSLDWSF